MLLDVVKCTLLLHFNQVKKNTSKEGVPPFGCRGPTREKEKGPSAVVKEKNPNGASEFGSTGFDRTYRLSSNQKNRRAETFFFFLCIVSFLFFRYFFFFLLFFSSLSSFSAYKGQHLKETKKESLLLFTFFFCFKLLF
jgi:hypothetical protein